jgi:hypothetical protein
MSKINDGMNDILMVTGDKSRKQLLSTMLTTDKADGFFLKSKIKEKNGNIDSAGLGL